MLRPDRARAGAVAWVAAASMAAMRRECDAAYPLETGGVFIGYWARPGEEAVITAIVGPGPGAANTRHGFRPDYAFQEAEIAQHYARSGRREAYLGDWHCHPDAADGQLSFKDRATLRRIAAHEAARAPDPLMGVLYGTPGAWRLGLWKGNTRRIVGLLPWTATVPVGVREF